MPELSDEYIQKMHDMLNSKVNRRDLLNSQDAVDNKVESIRQKYEGYMKMVSALSNEARWRLSSYGPEAEDMVMCPHCNEPILGKLDG